ncbi:MAG: hypothetical protein Q9176_004579 [Flavoplaca citrina]
MGSGQSLDARLSESAARCEPDRSKTLSERAAPTSFDSVSSSSDSELADIDDDPVTTTSFDKLEFPVTEAVEPAGCLSTMGDPHQMVKALK